MARITLETLTEALAPYNWKIISEKYQNLDTEMQFQCDQGHDVYISWKNLRNNIECPVCKYLVQNISTKEVPTKPRGATRVLALDQASHTTGYAIFDDTKLITSGTFEASGREEIERIASVKYWVLSMIGNWKPDVIGLEGIQFQEAIGTQHIGVTVFETLAHLQGVLMILCYENKIKFEICPTNTWRHACGVKGRSRADKKRSMQNLVKEWYGVNVTDDVADAIGIGRYLAQKVNKYNAVVDWENGG